MKSFIFISIAFGMLFLSLSPYLFSLSWYYSGASIICIDIYLLAVLFSAAAKSDNKLEKESTREKFTSALIPEKRLGLFIFSKLLATLIFGFANLYLGLQNGVKTGTSYLTSFYDSVYFSMVTISTAGFGDFVPVTDTAKGFVMWEIASGVLLVAGGFGLLISRLSNFD
jgi:hypothetical protein